MNNLFQFVVESAISMAVLFAIYWLFFRRETYFKFNRFYLMGSVLISIAIPLLSFETAGMNPVSYTYHAVLPGITVNNNSFHPFASSFGWQTVILFIYAAGFVLLFSRLMSGLLKIRKLKMNGNIVEKGDFSYVFIGEEYSPFSFFRYIFINKSQFSQSQVTHIIDHELIHVRQKHHIDNLISEIFLVIFWFNPFMWLIRKSIKANHEYLADSGVKRMNGAFKDYQTLLLRQINGQMSVSIANNFYSLIKSRIMMMYKSKSTVLAKCKSLLVVPVLLLLTLAFSCSENDSEMLQDPEIELISDDVIAEEVYYIVEEMPIFNGGGDPAVEFRKYIAKELEYPTVASDNGISGRVVVQFAVDKHGNVVDANVVRGVDPALDAEAVRVVLSSPKWKPGKQSGKKVKVLYTFPINYVLN